MKIEDVLALYRSALTDANIELKDDILYDNGKILIDGKVVALPTKHHIDTMTIESNGTFIQNKYLFNPLVENTIKQQDKATVIFSNKVTRAFEMDLEVYMLSLLEAINHSENGKGSLNSRHKKLISEVSTIKTKQIKKIFDDGVKKHITNVMGMFAPFKLIYRKGLINDDSDKGSGYVLSSPLMEEIESLEEGVYLNNMRRKDQHILVVILTHIMEEVGEMPVFVADRYAPYFTSTLRLIEERINFAHTISKDVAKYDKAYSDELKALELHTNVEDVINNITKLNRTARVIPTNISKPVVAPAPTEEPKQQVVQQPVQQQPVQQQIPQQGYPQQQMQQPVYQQPVYQQPVYQQPIHQQPVQQQTHQQHAPTMTQPSTDMWSGAKFNKEVDTTQVQQPQQNMFANQGGYRQPMMNQQPQMFQQQMQRPMYQNPRGYGNQRVLVETPSR